MQITGILEGHSTDIKREKVMRNNSRLLLRIEGYEFSDKNTLYSKAYHHNFPAY